MADEHSQPRTEAATPRRRQEAREQGQVALSHDLSAALTLLACLGWLWWGGAAVARQLLTALHNGLRWPQSAEWQESQTIVAAHWLAGQTVAIGGVLVAVAFLVALGSGLAQAGFQISFKPLAANWERLSPATGWSRLISWDAAVRGIAVLLKVSVVGVVLIWFLGERGVLLALLAEGTLGRSAAAAWRLALETGAVIAAAFLAAAAADYTYHRLRHELRLRMTREELKQEHKEDEGDPHVRARIRRLQREAAERKMIHEVPKATVVLTNPTHFAVAIRYDRHTMAAPKVIAKGSDRFARRIADVARQHGVPVLERKPLARLLFKTVRIGQEIPAELYQALAEILAYVYRLKRA